MLGCVRCAALGIPEASSAAAAAIHSLCQWCAAPLATQWPLVGQLYAAVQDQGGAAGPPPLPAGGQSAAGPAVAESDVQTVRFRPLLLNVPSSSHLCRQTHRVARVRHCCREPTPCIGGELHAG